MWTPNNRLLTLLYFMDITSQHQTELCTHSVFVQLFIWTRLVFCLILIVLCPIPIGLSGGQIFSYVEFIYETNVCLSECNVNSVIMNSLVAYKILKNVLSSRVHRNTVWNRHRRVPDQPLPQQRYLQWPDKLLQVHMSHRLHGSSLPDQHRWLSQQPVSQRRNLPRLHRRLQLRVSSWLYWYMSNWSFIYLRVKACMALQHFSLDCTSV